MGITSEAGWPGDSRSGVARDGFVEIRVDDEGPGVTLTEWDTIFDPFVRGEAGRLSAREGKGLGLFIARRVIEAHGGRVLVESTGTGATFTIEVPIGRSASDEGHRRAWT